ncbi:homeodomain-interacting protein kinase 2-like isoform X2 [Acanthopagrus latus]|uniref:homeodomain-interacting protein kinase 2-like isoform X2 n=1 Tax=Acanthopagrus latus TaxID=8177 RepID=UPI00187BF0A1|nr:homeodomain-interacting protein kinase 2-like isoform X2 [Acanthopagrus latus]
MSNTSRPRGLPSKFEFIQVEGEGGFGKVVKCIDMETLRFVAVKMPKWWCKHTKNEHAILEKNMSHKLDKHNIVKYIECFPTFFGKGLVFEALDISLWHYMWLQNHAPMSMSDIRPIIQQLATALDGLKEIGVIHTDVKSDNVMMVNHYRRPFEVKLIDFGLAIPTADAEKFRRRQLLHVTAPESFLGGELNEAIDMWALGCTLFQMVSGQLAFKDNDAYGMVSRMVQLLGMPSNHLLAKSNKADVYFTKTCTGVWRIKTPEEYYKHPPEEKWRMIKHLDDVRLVCQEEKNETEAVEITQCLELLKAMMTFDAEERITPREVLNHPFITKVYPKVQTPKKSCASKPPAAPLNKKAGSKIQPGNCTLSPEILTAAEISVRPVTAENATLLEGQESTVGEPTAAPLEDEASSKIRPGDCSPSPEFLTTAEISVRPVTAENTTLLEGQESTVGEPTAALVEDEASRIIGSSNCTPSPEFLTTAEISVRPVTAENTTLPDDQEIPVSFESGLSKMSESSVSNADSNRKISVDSTTCDTGPTAKGKKKKKNCFRRLLSWFRKTFCCCVSCGDVDEGCVE